MIVTPMAVAAAILVLPNLLFLATHLASPLLAVPCGLLLLAAAWTAFRGQPARPGDAVALAAAAVAAVGLCILGGQGGFLYANADWAIRNAVLHDLATRPWPVGYDGNGALSLLRAPLGMYLVPAAIGARLGLPAAHLALLAQNAALFGAVLYGLATLIEGRARRIWLIFVFCAFSGWDIVGQHLYVQAGIPDRTTAFPDHLEAWSFVHQFSSHVTQVFWVPNHALPGWAIAAAFLGWNAGRVPLAGFALVFGASVFWSPLAAIGGLPFAAFAGIRTLCDGAIDRRLAANLACLAAGLMPVAAFLSLDAGRVPHGAQPVDAFFLYITAVFLALEVGPFLPLLSRRAAAPAVTLPVLAIVLASLAAAPFFKLGAADFVMRASIPALAILAVTVAASTWPRGGRPPGWRLVWGLAALAVGAATPVHEIGRTLREPAPAGFAGCNLLEAAARPPHDVPLFHYLARVEAARQRAWLVREPDAFLTRAVPC